MFLTDFRNWNIAPFGFWFPNRKPLSHGHFLVDTRSPAVCCNPCIPVRCSWGLHTRGDPVPGGADGLYPRESSKERVG